MGNKVVRESLKDSDKVIRSEAEYIGAFKRDGTIIEDAPHGPIGTVYDEHGAVVAFVDGDGCRFEADTPLPAERAPDGSWIARQRG